MQQPPRRRGRFFGNSGTSAFLRKDNPRNVRAVILMHHSPEMTLPWLESLEESIRDGGVPFEKAHGTDLFSYLDRHESFDRLFSEAMEAVENLTEASFLEDFDWGAFERIIDVGGSRGSKSIAILRAFPKLRAVVFDRPQVIEAARRHWIGKLTDALLARIEFRPGDLFESLPAAVSDQDLYLFSAVFHGLSDEESARVLGRLRSAMGESNPHLLIVEAVVEESNINPLAAALDLQMLMGTRGRERTLGEWTALLGDSGFDIVEVIGARSLAKFILCKAKAAG